MQKSMEFTGKTEEAAIAAALEKLGLAREDISVEVLELAKPGFLGIGGTPAKVKVTFEAPEEPGALREEAPPTAAPCEAKRPARSSAQRADDVPTPTPVAAPAVEKAPKEPVGRDDLGATSIVKEAPAGDEKAQRITEFLTGLFEKMGLEATPRIQVDEEGNYLVELIGEDLGPVIGRRGETLDAIQQLTGYAVNRGENHRTRIRIDAEGYRSKREESLERMAHRVADKVVRYRRNMTLEPMNAYERHVIHTALQDRPDVTTYSVGTEPNRRTVVAYAPGEHRQ